MPSPRKSPAPVPPAPSGAPAGAPPSSLVGLPFERDSFASNALGDVVDRSVHAATARLTGGISPATVAEAYMDWAIHLASSPGKQMLLAQKALRKSQRRRWPGFQASGS